MFYSSRPTICKECKNKQDTRSRAERWKTKDGIIQKIYGHQKVNSRKRGHIQPEYKVQELKCWLLNDWLFNLIYDNWVVSGYRKQLAPSLDRIDDLKHYTLDNIQITTWEMNRTKQFTREIIGLDTRHLKSVKQLSKDGDVINIFHSVREAGRAIGISSRDISRVCSGGRKTAYGFRWEYA